MEAANFEATKSALDADLDTLDPTSSVGIMLGWDLYREFRRRDLLVKKRVDMVLWSWDQPSYRGRFVVDCLEDMRDDEYRVGVPNA